MIDWISDSFWGVGCNCSVQLKVFLSLFSWGVSLSFFMIDLIFLIHSSSFDRMTRTFIHVGPLQMFHPLIDLNSSIITSIANGS